MKDKKFIVLTSISLSLLLGSFFALAVHNNKPVAFLSDGSVSLILKNNRISEETTPYYDEQSSFVSTNNGNQLEIKSSNVLQYNDGWQTIMPNGYFYNPLNNTTHKNRISGVTSIKFESEDNKNLSLFYGYSLDNENIIYSREKQLIPNVLYELDDVANYFYIKNNNNVNIDIDEFSITYLCTDEDYQKQNLNILMIGNSFADDTLFYSARIAGSYGINLNLYDAYIAGCTLNQHYSNLQSGAQSYSMRSMNGNQWDYQDSMSLSGIIDSHTWDIITFQQASAEVGRPDSYSNLSNLVGLVRNMVGPTVKFYWHQTWAYDSDYHDYYDYFSYFNNDQEAMFDAIIDCYEDEVEPLGLFVDMIPAGTAVQNLRTSYMKETTSRDGKHMSSVHGRYLLGLNFISTIYDIDLDMSPCSFLPNEVNASYKKPAYESIKNACKNPLKCTKSQYISPELGEYDLSNYTEIDAELVGCSYWNSTDSSNYNKRISNSKDVSNLYTSTKRFTQSDLPIGSLVVIDEAFGVRPESWISDSVQYSRQDETYQNIIEVDSNFFNGYQYRAFNIFKAGKTTLLGQYSQIFDGFHIYVPNSSMAGLTPKGTNDMYVSDKTLFKSNFVNIDAFERIHLDPITGFYKCDSYYELTNSYVDDTAKKFVCTRPFYSANDDLPENTVIIVDSGYQWRSDCWGDHGSYSPRPNNVAASFTRLDSSFWNGFRRRTFNVSSTSSGYVNQNYIAFMNHMRIYIPISDDIEIERQDTVAMTALGYAQLQSLVAQQYGKNELPVLITLHGDDLEKVIVLIDGMDAGATNYTFNKSTNALSISTSDSNYGTITGTVNRDLGTITNLHMDGSFSSYITNNGSITCSEMWFDRCNYSTNAASQAVWQRWYMSGSWQANSGSGEWTTANANYLLDNDYSMGLRIANSSYEKTRFTLKQDFNGGSGFNPHGISIWLYNPNGNIYSSFRIYTYQTPSSIDNDHAFPSSTYSEVLKTSNIGSNEWVNFKVGLSDCGTIYNISFYFETSSSATTYVYLGHVSFY